MAKQPGAGRGGLWSPVVCEGLEPRALLAAAPTVTGFALIDADTDRPVASVPLLADGGVLDLSKLPSRHLNVRADVGTDVRAGSVRFGYDAKASYRVENGAPYALASNSGADYFAWTPAVGAHTLSATAYTLMNAAGAAGPTRTVRFTVTNGTTPPPPAPTPLPPAPTPTPPPPPSASGSFTITAAQVGTTGLRLTWPAQPGADGRGAVAGRVG